MPARRPHRGDDRQCGLGPRREADVDEDDVVAACVEGGESGCLVMRFARDDDAVRLEREAGAHARDLAGVEDGDLDRAGRSAGVGQMGPRDGGTETTQLTSNLCANCVRLSIVLYVMSTRRSDSLRPGMQDHPYGWVIRVGVRPRTEAQRKRRVSVTPTVRGQTPILRLPAAPRCRAG